MRTSVTTRWRRQLPLVVIALVVLDLAAGTTRVVAGDRAERPLVAQAPITIPSSTTTTTTALAPLPVPEDTPDAEVSEPLVELGTLAIPALDLEATLYEGITLPTIDHGPSHWPGTAMPGHVGNVVVAGHRITHSHPFRHLDDLVEGDLAILSTAEGAFTYTFAGQDIVTPEQVEIADQTTAYTATFFACHPPGSLRYRIVAHWRLVSAPAPGQPDPATLPSA
ncbi:MAG: class E sortase [Acidimicrobiales bacterium]